MRKEIEVYSVYALGVLGLVLAVTLATSGDEACAQQLGHKKGVSAPADSKLSRIIAEAKLQALQQDGKGLQKGKLTITHKCAADLQLGGTTSNADKTQTNSLVGSNVGLGGDSKSLKTQQQVVVAEDIVNTCD